MRRRAWIWLGLFGLCAYACASGAPRAARPSSPQPETGALHYAVALDPGAQRLSVELCFEGRVPSRLIYGTREAADFLLAPERVGRHGRRAPLRVEAGLLSLPPGAPSDCVTYGVDLRRALARDSLLLAYPGEQSVLLAAELFLWRPQRRSPGLRSTLRFVLPDGMRASAPWRELDAASGLYELDERAFAFTGHVVLGKFERRRVAAPGTRLRVVTLPGFAGDTAALLQPWLSRAAQVASLPGGFFPVPDAQVIVVPTSPSVFPIYFGHTGRSGGASVVLFLPTDVDAHRLQDDWIAIHEFCHLWHPFVQREDAWLSEGIATYLQEVLRARAGLVSREQVWQRLFEGAQLGRDATGSLREETRRMPFAHNYQRVYWAGAAIALMLDVELRRQSSGALSLELLLARLREHPEWYLRAHSAREILRELDRLAGLSVCEALAARHVNGPLPDLRPLFGQLGLAPDGDRVREAVRVTQAPAPLAWVRDAIMTGSADLATARPLGGG